ncbi:carotenoid oxygenase family protein [Pseudonocardia benzenivorans]|uniref:Dioxygenase n=1 Tax=Pseudonocardia benzenivorans TaxID=228005 RepID=A0ABW3VI92_9PSEU
MVPGTYLTPVPDEIEARDLPVEGTLPSELTGRYFRNGPNPLPGDRPAHWFAGHGMLHGEDRPGRRRDALLRLLVPAALRDLPPGLGGG